MFRPAYPFSYTKDSGDIFPGLRRPERENGHSCPPEAEVKNGWPMQTGDRQRPELVFGKYSVPIPTELPYVSVECPSGFNYTFKASTGCERLALNPYHSRLTTYITSYVITTSLNNRK